MARSAVCRVRNAWLTSVCTARPRARTCSSRLPCCARAAESWVSRDKLLKTGSETVSRAWNGCWVNEKGYCAFWLRSACSLALPHTYWLQSLGARPALARIWLSSRQLLYCCPYAPCCPRMTGSSSGYFWVNPDQIADRDSVGP